MSPLSCIRSFNPLPSPKQGETGRGGLGRVVLIGFNPLPSPKQGETMPSRVVAAPASPVSIRSPHRSKGRRATANRPRRFLFVSIRSPHRSKGRQESSWYDSSGDEFQSAPLTEARGDPIVPGHAKLAVVVSIRSPHRSKGRRVHMVNVKAPLSCFNPLPSPKQGETPRYRRIGWRWDRFNPLPSPKQGETSASPPIGSNQTSFNPLPSPKQGETGNIRGNLRPD